ncbi:MAG TPA: hypothetical protein VGV90_06235 [Solirubrobacteraceae bacterium]|nr:hypothetical protein [Solirubrobacteraceae bacterium]
MRRPLLLTLLLAVLPALAALAATPAHGGFFSGDAIDGPSPDIRALGDLDLARDGTGVLSYVKRLDGTDRVFATRFEGGVFQPPEPLDASLGTAGSQPVVGASSGGRLVVVFVSGGVVYGVVRPAGAGWSAPVALGAGTDPAVDLSINGTAFASFTSAGDVRVARLDRRTNGWSVLEQPADVDPGRAAGVGAGRSRVAISADGVGVVTWAEAGHVFARKMFGTGLSSAPQDLTPASFEGRVATTSDVPDVDAEDDSSYAWVVFRQRFADGGSRILARRQRGTTFDPPVAVDAPAGEAVGPPRIDLTGRGVAVAVTAGTQTGQPMTAITDRDVFGIGERLFLPSVVTPAVVPAIAENNDGLIGAVIGPEGEPPYVRVRTIEDGKLGPERTLSRPELGPVVPELGFDVAADRGSGAIAAWIQGGAADRRIVAGYLDRPPGFFAGYTSQRCCQPARPTLSWQPAFNLWGPVRYVVSVDGTPVGETTETSLQLTAPLTPGAHRWQVVAFDPRGQGKRARTRTVRVDARAPSLSVRYRRRGRVVTVSVRARDIGIRGRTATGLRSVVISWGDRTKGAAGTSSVRASHRYRGGGSYPLQITAKDRAGNQRTSLRTVRIG